MPIYEYQCAIGHKVTRLFKTFMEADAYADSCKCDSPGCTLDAVRVPSVPLPAHFLGRPDGYHKPSPTKRHSYKLSSEEGNEYSAG